MSGKNKNVFSSTLVAGILMIVVGILCCIFRTGLLNALMTVIGVVAIILGILNIIAKDLVQGIAEIVVGVVIIVCGWVILDIALLIVGIVLIAYAVYLVVKDIPALKKAKGKDLALMLIYPILLFVFGILLVVAKWSMTDIIFIIAGILAILAGVSMTAKALLK